MYAAPTITAFSRRSTPIHLLTQANTGLCGPGGARVTTDGSTIVYRAFETNTPSLLSLSPRTLYTAHLEWSADGPWVT